LLLRARWLAGSYLTVRRGIEPAVEDTVGRAIRPCYRATLTGTSGTGHALPEVHVDGVRIVAGVVLVRSRLSP